MLALLGVEWGISDIISVSEGSRDKCYYSPDLSSQQKMLYSQPYSYKTLRTHPGCSESKCVITVVPTWHLQGKALGLRLQAISWASSHPSPSNHNQPSPAEGECWGWVSAAITYHRELDFCPQIQLPLCPLLLRQQQSWPAEMGCEQVWEAAFSWLTQLLPASSQTGEKPIKRHYWTAPA